MNRRAKLTLTAYALLVAFLLFHNNLGVFAAQEEFTGQWWLDKKCGTPGGYCVNLRYESGDRGWGSYHNWQSSTWVETSHLRGFQAELLSSPGTKAEFSILRDAGSFQCEGWFASGKGSGHFKFVPDQRYIQELSKRGIGSPTPEQQMQLALNDTSLELVDVLKKAGYNFDITELVRASNHGLSVEYVKGMNALGYKPETLSQLVRMRDHGVTPNYVREMTAAGITNQSEEQIVKLRDHGVDPEYIQEMAAAGLGKLPAEQLVRMRDHGVDAKYIHTLAEQGIKGLDGEELARLRDHGVDADFISFFRKMDASLSTRDLTRLRDHGVSTSFVRDVHDAGFKDVSVEELVKLRDHGVDGSYLARYGKGRSIGEVIRMKDRGFSADWN